jgi:hypothetical protein
MTRALHRLLFALPLGIAACGDFGAAEGVGALTPAEGTRYSLRGAAGALAAGPAIRLTTAEPGPRPRLRLTTEPPRLAYAPGDVARLFAAPLTAPPSPSDSS